MSKTIMIYTDGACSGNPGPGGWAFTINHELDFKVYGGYELDTTNNRMELLAVVKALMLLRKFPQYKTAIINSDSAYVINSITKGWINGWQKNGWRTKQGKAVANSDLWHKLLILLSESKHTIHFNKVAGHSGNTFNELADKEAKAQVMKAKEYMQY